MLSYIEKVVSNSSENILHALEMLSEDKRLASVLGSDSSNSCALHLWLLELEHDKSPPQYRLLFAWVIPTTLQNSDEWNISDGGKKENRGIQDNSYKFRIAKLTLYFNSNAIFNLIKELCQGNSLDDSCDASGIARPKHQKNPYGQLRLAGSPKQVAESFAVRSVLFLETSETNRPIIKELQSIVSPIDNVPAFAASLWRLDKLNLFSRNGEKPLPEADDLAKKCLSHLTEETGLDFCGMDSKRLGNIEWLYFPTADENENSQVKISIDSSGYGVEVEILPDALKSATQVLVRCRLLNDREVILDQCKTSQITETSTRVNFEANQIIGKVLVTIWIRQNYEDTWEIWYEYSFVPLQQININLGLIGSEGSLQLDWLQEYTRSKIHKVLDRVKKVQAFRQVHYDEHIEVGGYQSSPWIAANQKIHKLTQKLFPEPSGGRFFPSGWDADGPGRLSFSEWLKSLTNNFTASKILIIDPFFDTVGITELIARAEAAQAEYVVLTNSQIKSDDNSLEQEIDKVEEPSRATQLKKACKDLEFSLTNLKFRLLDLRSKQGGKAQLFHDRYILVFEQSNEVKTGYHLSNSIQGATKKHPLLITPIPEDVLPAVKDYVNGLLAPADDSPNQLITLFSSVNGTKTPSFNEFQCGLAAIPYAGFFFAALLNENILLHISESELVDYLQKNGILIEEGSSFAINKQIDSQLDYFVQVLVASSAENFAKLWIAFASWLAQLPDSDEYFSKIIASGGENLTLKIQEFLSDAPEQQLPLGLLKAKRNTDSDRITQLISHNFKKVLHEAEILLKSADCNLWSDFLQNWGIRYGADALARHYPRQLVSIASTLTAELQTAQDAHKYWAIADTLTLIVKQILNQLIQIQPYNVAGNDLFPTLLVSDVPLLRAIAAQSLSPSWNGAIEFHQICSNNCYLRYVVLFSQTDCGKTATDLFAFLITTVTLADSLLQDTFTATNKLQEVERIYTLAEWVFELRIRANKDADYKRLRLQIFERINRIWSVDFTQEDLRDIVCRLNGPGEGSWSMSTTNELLLPLVEDKKLTVEQIAQLWLTILFERLKAHVSTTEPKKDGKALFFVWKDTELTNVCAWILANANLECQKSWLKQLKEEIKKPGERILFRIFSRSRDYSAWQGARDGLLWLQILVNLILLYGVNGITSNSGNKELEEVAIKLDSILVNSFKQNLLDSTNALLDFASCVKEDLEKQQNLLANRNNI